MHSALALPFVLLAQVVPVAPPPVPAPPTPPPLVSPAPVASESPLPPPESPAPGSTPAPGATPSPAPSPGVTPSPAPTPTLPASPIPSPSPGGPYQFVVHPSPAPNGSPQILEIAVNSQVQHSGGDLMLKVTTSPDVFQVQLRAMGRILPLPQAASGVFSGEQRIPTGIPFFFLNRWYNVDFIATNGVGVATSVTVPFRFER